ncbi:hypothetical protein IM40_08365 [Candidatus Paracaedimonas acanthamoebae]|nr:hypothetical protein IM40_08365 [Candidatus Paracaedimonas acanthamoebae]
MNIEKTAGLIYPHKALFLSYQKVNKLVRYLFLACFLCTPSIGTQNIHTITSYDEVPWEKLGHSPKKIFMFDIYDTQVRMNLLSTIWGAVSHRPIESIKQLWTYAIHGDKKGIIGLGTLYMDCDLIDKTLLSRIDNLIANDHIVWNLTNLYTGPLDGTTFEAQTACILDRKQLHRSPILVNGVKVDRVDFQEYQHAHPVFYKGVTVNDKRSKVDIMKYRFLPWLQNNTSYHSISDLVYFDDMAGNVKGIEEVCKEFNINYTGFICNFGHTPILGDLSEEF